MTLRRTCLSAPLCSAADDNIGNNNGMLVCERVALKPVPAEADSSPAAEGHDEL